MIRDTDLKYSDTQAMQCWASKKSAESARSINRVTADQLAEARLK